jgi:GNAT superfamily N-acetyltransferase
VITQVSEKGATRFNTKLLQGEQASEVIPDIARLRLSIFREYPYLYDGKSEDEYRYLRLYAETPDAFVITVSDSELIIGAATGIPLHCEHRELIDPFASSPYPVDKIYYVGELLFMPEYRNQGLGLSLIAMITDQVRSLGNYSYLTCATLLRPDEHPLRPEGYAPIDRFLARTGFSLLPGVTTSFSWKETDGVVRDHQMQFWLKELN